MILFIWGKLIQPCKTVLKYGKEDLQSSSQIRRRRFAKQFPYLAEAPDAALPGEEDLQSSSL